MGDMSRRTGLSAHENRGFGRGWETNHDHSNRARNPFYDGKRRGVLDVAETIDYLGWMIQLRRFEEGRGSETSPDGGKGARDPFCVGKRRQILDDAEQMIVYRGWMNRPFRYDEGQGWETKGRFWSLVHDGLEGWSDRCCPPASLRKQTHFSASWGGE
jgi:hypothetical protein